MYLKYNSIIIAVSRQTIDIPQPMYVTIDKAFFSPVENSWNQITVDNYVHV